MIRYGKRFLICLVLTAAAAAASKSKAPTPMTNEECLACHSDPTLFKETDGKKLSLGVDETKFKASIHGSMFQCVDCHKDVKDAPHSTPPAKPNCATCHSDEVAAYDRGFHAKALKNGDSKAAHCADCHGGPHEILPASDTASPVNHANIPRTCGSCHGQKFVMESSGHSAAQFFSYEESVHGKAVAAGSAKAAVCTDCHGTHEILSAGDSKSPIFKFNVPTTCAKCHDSVKQEFMASIHGQAVARGNSQAPVCTDCHGIHSIKSHIDPTSSVAAQALARTTCARCHEGVRLSQEFGLEGRRATTYLESYHGLASKLGSQVVANCASCHGVHNILPSSDPHSTINKANLRKTCGTCHPGASEKFVDAKVHIDAPLSADIGSVAVRWVRRFYVGVIGVTIGFMLLHNFIVWRRKALLKRQQQHRYVVRMNTGHRIQHLTLLLSFFVLVVTGFSLAYPDSAFARMFGANETLRSWIHRIAGTVLIGVSLYHVFYIATRRDGRRLLFALLPVPKDVFDLKNTLLHSLGFDVERPQSGRFSYGEKLEYWALVWGMIVMASTGLMLWFKVIVGQFLPRWWADVSTAVHFYEAVLATLAIVVWHFYQVIFDPDVYPMNWAWFDGKMSVEQYHEEHGLDHETLLEAVEQAANQDAANAPSEPADEQAGQLVPSASDSVPAVPAKSDAEVAVKPEETAAGQD